jgi:hypothetical protein
MRSHQELAQHVWKVRPLASLSADALFSQSLLEGDDTVGPTTTGALKLTGLHEQALQWLEKAYESRSSWIATIKYDPILDNLRSHPRFQNLVGRVGQSP